MTETSAQILNLSKQVAEKPAINAHVRGVLAQLAFANQIFDGIGAVCEKGNGLAGETLLRTLFEVITSTIILAKHPDKLGDFIEHGRMTELRMMRVIETPALKQRLEPKVTATDTEFQQLWAKFNERRWHGHGTRESFVEAEFDSSIYDRYYRRVSAIAHGQPYVTVREGRVQAYPTAWKNLALGAANAAMLMMVTLLAVLNREFKFALDEEIVRLQQETDAQLKQHMDAITKLGDAQMAVAKPHGAQQDQD
jgi:hypothetical protein